MGLPEFLGVHAESSAGGHQRHFGGIAALRRGLRGERCRLEELVEARRALATQRVGRESASPDPHVPGGHAVLGERAGLVRADDRDRPEGLHRGEPLHEALLADHALDAERQRERERRQQTLRDIGDDDAKSEEESLAHGENARRHAEGEESGAQGGGKEGDQPGDPRHLALQRARRLGHRLGELGDDAGLRLHGGGAHDEAARAGDHRGSREDQLRPLPGRHAGPVVSGCRQLEHRVRLAGERALVDPQSRRREELAVGRHPVTLADLDDVAGHELAGGEAQFPTRAERGDRRGEHLLERFDGPFGAVFLQEAEDAVDDDHGEDRPAQLGHPGQHGEDPGHPEEDGEEAPELLEETHEERPAPDALEPVRAACKTPPGGLGGAEPGRARAEQTEQLGGAERHLAGRALGGRQRFDQRLACRGRAGAIRDPRLGQASHQPADQTEGARAVSDGRDEDHGGVHGRQAGQEPRSMGKVDPAEAHAPGIAGERVDQGDTGSDEKAARSFHRRKVEPREDVAGRGDLRPETHGIAAQEGRDGQRRVSHRAAGRR